MMSSLRSSVRPKSSKQAWGTILHPEFGMGYQKMTSYEVEQTVSRLYISPDRPERYYERVQQAELSGEGIKGMLKRLTKEHPQRAADSDRRQTSSIYKNLGVVNSYAWKGYN